MRQRMTSLISAKSSDLTTEDGKAIFFFHRNHLQHMFFIPAHVLRQRKCNNSLRHMSSDKENITTLLAPKLKCHWAHYKKTQSLLRWYAQMS